MKKEIIRLAAITLAFAVCVGLAPAWIGSRAAAQGAGTISGNVKDQQGKPMTDVTVVIHPIKGGADVTATTGSDGHFAKLGLPAGDYVISFKEKNLTLYEVQGTVAAGRETRADLDMNDPKVAEAAKRRKADSAEEEKVGKLKAHVNAGNAALQQEQDLRAQLGKATADQKADLQAKLDQESAQAVAEFQQAIAAIGTTDADKDNRASVFYSIGFAYETDGKYSDAVDFYRQAVALKPDAGTYNNLGNVLAKSDKMDEAKVAYDKSAEIDPAHAAQAYRNFAIVLLNAGKLQGSPAPDLLKKATQLEPNNAQGWYLLGVALTANMEVKQEGEKMIFTILPGTAEALQKSIDLDPKGPFATQAKQQLEELKVYGAGVDTKYTAPKVKH